jgi:hypothetical protein
MAAEIGVPALQVHITLKPKCVSKSASTPFCYHTSAVGGDVSDNKYERIKLKSAAEDKKRIKNGAQEKTNNDIEELMRGNLWQYRIIKQ